MATEERKDNKKPFKGVSDAHTNSRVLIIICLQAKVEWPADMPDDMLEDSIAIAKKTLDEHDFETDGVEVSHRLVSNTSLRCFQFDAHIFNGRLRKKSRSTWTRNGSHTGTYSQESLLVAIRYMNATASCILHSSLARSLS